MSRPEDEQSTVSWCGGKATVGTMWLRGFGAVVLIFSSVAAMLYIAVLGIDEVYQVQISENVYSTGIVSPIESDAPAATINPATPVLLFPQLRASIGFNTVCVSSNCFQRSRLSGVLPLVELSAQAVAGMGLPEAVLLAYREATYQYIFGFDIGEHCGTPRRTTEFLGKLWLAAVVLSLIFHLGLFCTGMIFFSLVQDTDVLAGRPTFDSDLHVVTVDVLSLPGPYVARKINRHLRWGEPVLWGIALLSLLALGISLCATGVTIALIWSRSKCGRSLCSAFDQGMENFYSKAASFDVRISAPRNHSCHRGSLDVLVIVASALCTCCVMASVALLLCYKCTRRREKMLAMRAELLRLTEMHRSARSAANSGTNSRQVTTLADPSSRQSTFRASGDDHLPSTFSANTNKSEEHRSHLIGTSTGMYQQLGQLIAEEENIRDSIGVMEIVELRTMWTQLNSLCPGNGASTSQLFASAGFAALFNAGVAERLDCAHGISSLPSPMPSLLERKRATLERRERSSRLLISQKWRYVHVQMRRSFQRTSSNAGAASQLLGSSTLVGYPEEAPCAGSCTDALTCRVDDTSAISTDQYFLVDSLRGDVVGTGALYHGKSLSENLSGPLEGVSVFTPKSVGSCDEVHNVQDCRCADNTSATSLAGVSKFPSTLSRGLKETPPEQSGMGRVNRDVAEVPLPGPCELRWGGVLSVR